MEKRWGKLRNSILGIAIGFAVVSSITQLVGLSNVMSFYFAAIGMSLLVVGLILMVVIYIDTKKQNQG